MTLELALAAFTVGLLGSGHCLAMCGGIVTTLCGSSRAAQRDAAAPRANLALVLGYHAGRIGSYAAAGAVAGTVGSFVWLADHALPAQRVLMVTAALLLLATGLYLLGFAHLIAPLERLGARLWQHIAPVAARLAPAKTPLQAIGLGALWGWIPCGLIYGALAIAATTGSPLGGALTMLAFGTGTLPALLAASAMAVKLAAFIRHRSVRTIAGVLVVLSGLSGLLHVMHDAMATPSIDPLTVSCAAVPATGLTASDGISAVAAVAPIFPSSRAAKASR